MVTTRSKRTFDERPKPPAAPAAPPPPPPPPLATSSSTPELTIKPSKKSRLSGRRTSWAPGTASPPKSRQQLHKQARALSDAALDDS
eukprot:337198-Prymnesium_polylepis.1